jgi:hypothetical protein
MDGEIERSNQPTGAMEHLPPRLSFIGKMAVLLW